jgi:hypothetical protein
MDDKQTNDLARESGQYPPPRIASQSCSRQPKHSQEAPQSRTWSERIDDLKEKAAYILIGLILTALKLAGLSFLFGAAFALYPDNFFGIPFVHLTFGDVLSFAGSCILALLGVWFSILWLQVKKH